MIISANPVPPIDEFNSLLVGTMTQLNLQAQTSPKEIVRLSGNKLEPYVMEVMTKQAIGTPFEKSIELISGQKFPDIVANKFYGVEVKSTTQNHWKTTGNSVLESTRVDGVERIFMLFGKLGHPIEFRCRRYEECLSEVVVTHSPRYLIDMNLDPGATIFDKIQINYDELRLKENPIKPIVAYYRSKLKPGEDIWWMDQGGNTPASSLIIKIWSNLGAPEKLLIKSKAMAFFPEICGNRIDKFSKLTIWLLTQEAIVCPNVRDLFTSGGKSDITIGAAIFPDVPKIVKSLFTHLNSVKEIIQNTPSEILSEHWKRQTSNRQKFQTWTELVDEEVRSIPDARNLRIKEMISLFFA